MYCTVHVYSCTRCFDWKDFVTGEVLFLNLQKIESELHEQAIQLESLHKAGEDISSNLDPQGKTAGQIQAQLKDFDNCWNDITKRVIQKRHKVSQIKLLTKQ